MVLKNFTYYEGKTKKSIKVIECKTIWSKFSGLMFRKKSPPLLFIFNKEKNISIHSLFCKPFLALWIDEKWRVTAKMEIKSAGLNFSGIGKYLLEIPIIDDKNIHSRMINPRRAEKQNI